VGEIKLETELLFTKCLKNYLRSFLWFESTFVVRRHTYAYSSNNRTEAAQNKSRFLLKIILQNTQTLQLFTINLKQIFLQKILKMLSSKAWGWEDLESYN
jgi:hypothetical protein